MKLTPILAKSFLPARDPNGHKGTFGKVYCLCGSQNMFGAGILSVSAALRSGAGLCTIGGCQSLCEHIVSARPEAVAHIWGNHTSLEEIASRINSCSAAVIGSGLGAEKRQLVRDLVPLLTVPLVLDADGIRAMAEAPDAWDTIHAPFVITPHLGEMAAVCRLSPAEIASDRVNCSEETARKIGGTVLLKGPGSIITDGVTTWQNTTGSCALATPGSGDVLGGLIAGLMAQGASLSHAAAVGAYLHGLAGDLAEQNLTAYSVIASDILDYLPKAFLKVIQSI